MTQNRSSWTRRLLAIAAAAVLTYAMLGSGCGGEQQAKADKEKTETLVSGTALVGALQNTIDTGHNKVGDKVAVRTLEDVRVNEATVVPAGSMINGEVTHIDPAGRVAGGAELTIRFIELVTPDGKSYAISANPLAMKGKGDAKESAAEVGGGAAAGAIIGGIAGGGKGAAKGALIGGAAGAGVAVATKGDQIVLPAGRKVTVTLNGPVTITMSKPSAS